MVILYPCLAVRYLICEDSRAEIGQSDPRSSAYDYDAPSTFGVATRHCEVGRHPDRTRKRIANHPKPRVVDLKRVLTRSPMVERAGLRRSISTKPTDERLDRRRRHRIARRPWPAKDPHQFTQDTEPSGDGSESYDKNVKQPLMPPSGSRVLAEEGLANRYIWPLPLRSSFGSEN